MESDDCITQSSFNSPVYDDVPEALITSVKDAYQPTEKSGQFSVVGSEVENFVDSSDIMPQILEFSSDDSVSSTEMFFVEENSTYAEVLSDSAANPETEAVASLLNADQSVAFGDVQFDSFAQLIDNATAASSCFSRSSLLVCDDSLDSVSKDAASFTTAMQSTATQEQREIDDSPITTVEETSMDSGLGSVESAGVNSEEESTPSPDICLVPSFSEGRENVPQYNNQQSNQDESFYDCLSSITEAATQSNSNKRSHGEWEGYNEARKKPKTERKVGFCDVTVYYFPRRQGFVSVPSQGGSTLGMDIRHIHSQTMSLKEHKEELKRKHKQLIKQHMKERKLEDRIKQLRTLNPELDAATISSMATNELTANLEANEDSDNDDSLLDDVDDFFFLQPIPAKKRREILRSSGLERIDGEEKLMNRVMRQSREMCGCSCAGLCNPESCECALAGIQCQVDRDSFPCGCMVSGCQNPNGRVEFDSERVRFHTEATMKQLQLIEEGANPGCAVEDKEPASTSGSESDCELLSSDDADQSESESVEFVDHLVSITNEIMTDYNEGLEQHDPQEFQPQMQFWTLPPQTESQSSVVSGQNLYSVPDEMWVGPYTAEKQVPQEFLATLGLERIESHAFYTPTATSTEVCTGSAGVHLSSSGTFYDSWPDFMENGTNLLHFPQLPDIAPQEGLNPFSSPESRMSQSMFGTTTPRQDGGAAPVVRDCAVLLDPIATFMPGTPPVTTSGLVS